MTDHNSPDPKQGDDNIKPGPSVQELQSMVTRMRAELRSERATLEHMERNDRWDSSRHEQAGLVKGLQIQCSIVFSVLHDILPAPEQPAAQAAPGKHHITLAELFAPIMQDPN